MRTIIQRVQEASVTVNDKVHGKIGRGFLVLLGVCEGDTLTDGKALAAKCAKLRVFEDEAGKMNLGLSDIGGSVLAVSNFTLYADCSHGNRPSFSGAARPELALPLYESFCEELRKLGIPTETGIFGADMKLALINDGPVTIVMDAKDGKVLGI